MPVCGVAPRSCYAVMGAHGGSHVCARARVLAALCRAVLRCADYANVVHLRDAKTHTTHPRSANKDELGGSLKQLETEIKRCVL